MFQNLEKINNYYKIEDKIDEGQDDKEISYKTYSIMLREKMIKSFQLVKQVMADDLTLNIMLLKIVI